MVDSKKQNTAKHIENQGKYQTEGKSNKINASTHYATCDARMTAFGGLLILLRDYVSVPRYCLIYITDITFS